MKGGFFLSPSHEEKYHGTEWSSVYPKTEYG